jgi:5'-3' exonuclease
MISSWDAMMDDAVIPNDNLLIVDALNLAMRWKHKGALEFAGEFVKTVNSFGKSYHAAEIVVLVDYKGSDYRKFLHPGYKSDRKKKFTNQTEEEAAAAALFFEEFEKAIDLCTRNFHVIKMKGVEADDVATYLVEKYEDGEVFNHIWMISTDRDWDELLGDYVSRFAYTSRREFTISNFFEDHGCDSPEQYTSIKAVKGDAGDSVYGVGGIGTKRAYNLIKQYGDALDLACQLPLEGSQKYIQELNKSYDKLCLNVQLVDLRGFHKEAIAFPDTNNIVELEKICNKMEERFINATY